MNKETLYNAPHLRNKVFSYCGIFSAKSSAFHECVGKDRLFGLVRLPDFESCYQFTPYRIPYEWLSDRRPPEAGPSESQTNGHQTATSYYSQRNMIRISNAGVFNQLVVSQCSKNMALTNEPRNKSYVFPSHFSISETWNKSSTIDLHKYDAYHRFTAAKRVKIESKVAHEESVKSANTKILLSHKIVSGRKKNGSREERFGLSMGGEVELYPAGKNDNPSDFSAARDINLYERFVGTTASAHLDHVSDASVHANRESVHEVHRNANLQQESIQRTIKTLASKNAEVQLESREQFSGLQQQLKNAEQVTHKDMRHLQQSVLELKNMLGLKKNPMPLSPSRPPSFYGRFK